MTPIAYLIFVSVSGVLFADMIDDFLQPGMIFSFWGRVLEKNSNFEKWYFKPLWGCLKCTNIWILMLSIVCFFYAPVVLNCVFVLSLGNWMYKILDKYDLL